jgi:hypothetical protein
MPQRRVLRHSVAPDAVGAAVEERVADHVLGLARLRMRARSGVGRERARPQFLLSAYGVPGAPAADPSAGDTVAYAWSACDAA